MNRRSKQRVNLPDEIWFYIFEHFMTPFQLKSVRLVCRNWNRIVRDSSKLLNRFTITVPAVRDAVSGWQHVVTSRYTTMHVWNFTPGMIPFSPLTSIRTLCLVNPWITAKQLVQMLGSLPNLVYLRLVSAANFNYEMYETRPAVQLERLECLSLNLGPDEFLCTFQNICPSLKSLTVKMTINKYLEAPYGAKLLEFIRSKCNTLEQVYFEQIEFREESLLRDIASVEGLKLKNVSLINCFFHSTDIAFFCERQNNIEALRLPPSCIGSDILTSIAINLPNLKELELHTHIVDLLLFLSNLPHLHKLVMTYRGQFVEMLDLSAWRNPNLLHLSLSNFFLNSTTLLAFFKGSPNIRTLKLYFGTTIGIHDVLVIAGQLKELRQLAVYLNNPTPTPVHFMDLSYSPFLKLRQLNIYGEIYTNILSLLLEKCPLLQDLTLSRCIITDNDMLLLVQFMKNLTMLCFDQLQSIGVPSGQLVVQRCPKLETLTIIDCPLLGQFVPQQSSIRVVYKPILYHTYW